MTTFKERQDQIGLAGMEARLSKGTYKGMEYEITKQGRYATNDTPWIVYVEGARLPGYFNSVSEAMSAVREYIDKGPQ